LFAAREVGDALASVARGTSYRGAATSARKQAERVKAASPRPRPPGAPRRRGRTERSPESDGQLVANWVDVLAPLIIEQQLPREWPQTLLLDSKAFLQGSLRGGRRFHVLGAVGVPVPTQQQARSGARPRASPWLLEPTPTRNAQAWAKLLRSLEGTPDVIVADAEHAIHVAINRVFPRPGGTMPEVRLCEYHVKMSLQEKVPSTSTSHAITDALDRALVTPSKWQAFLDAVAAEEAINPRGMRGMRRWLNSYGARVEAQVRTRSPHGPHSTSPVEALLREVGNRIGPRVGSFANRSRMRNLLQLQLLDIRGQANGRAWADLLRESIYLTGGRATQQRPHDDSRGTHSLYV